MEPLLALTAQSRGREKLYRTAQYACTLLHYLLQRSSHRGELATRIRRLESHISTGRKLFRLGMPIDALSAAQRTIHLSDPVLRFCLTLAHINRVLYLLCDHVLWIRAAGVAPNVDAERWANRSHRHFLVSSLLSVVRDAYEINLLVGREPRDCWVGVEDERRPDKHHWKSASPARKACVWLSFAVRVLRANPSLLVDTIKNLCDLVIPLERLGMLQVSRGCVGTCGLVSSLLSVMQLCHPDYILKP
uniref:peroxisomal membrane protein 11B-like n=2 Tax=Myxine glutinosa TaxID=7769 RepID=UPI00359024A6